MAKKKFYQVGGALDFDADSYVKRNADTELYNNIIEGEYCFVLKYRQVGKSSLRVHCSHKLENEGFKCVNIDLTSLGTDIKSSDEWYYSLLYNIVDELKLSEVIFNEYWSTYSKLTVTSRCEVIIDKFILKSCTEKIVIFIDEIDSILGIVNFCRDDFFALIRRFHILRAEDERYKRLVFILLGVASVNDLMEEKNRTPFNIAKDITIGQFTLRESYHLIGGLNTQRIDKNKILERVFEWTSGTSYLTQKTLEFISKNPIEKIEEVDEIISKLFLLDSSNEINIQTIETRILNNKTHNAKMLYMLARILDNHKIEYENSWRTMIYLKLSGLIKVENGVLTFSNRIYKTVFNHSWLRDMIEKIDRPIANDLQKWLVSGRSEDYLMKGDTLEKNNSWAKNRDDLSGLEHIFLTQSIKAEDNKKIEITKRKANYISSILLFIVLVFVIISGKYYYSYKEKKLIIKNKQVTERINKEKEIKLKLKELILETNPKLELYQEYNISIRIEDKDSIEKMIFNSIRLSKEFDKKFWVENLEKMTDEDKVKLFNILKYYAYIDKADEYHLEHKYEEAIKFYKKSIEYNNEKPDAYIQLGKIYFNLKQYKKTIEIYNEISNKNKKIYFFIGSSYTKLKQYDKALDYYKKILNKYPKNTKALFKIAEIYLEQQKYQKAIKTYEDIIKLNFNAYEAYAQIANVYFSQGKYKKAMIFYDQAIKINPDSSLIRSRDLVYKEIKKENIKISNFYQRGIEANKIGDYINAITYFKQSKKTDFKFHNALGFAYCKLGRYDDARRHYKKSKNLEPKKAKIYALFGHLEYKEKEYEKSIENYHKSIALNSKDRNINIHLYSAYIAFFHEQLIKNNKVNNASLEDSFKKYFNDKKEFLAYYEALKILENIYFSKRKVNINNWLEKYKEVTLNKKSLEYIYSNWIKRIKKNSLRFKVNSTFEALKNAVPDIQYISFFKAIEEAEKEQKVVMIFVDKIGCPWCDKLEQKLQNSLDLKKMIYEHFKIVKVDRDNLPMNLSVTPQDKSPVLIFIEPKTKLEVRKYSKIYIEDLSINMEEDIKEWKDSGYLKRSIRDERIERFNREGWIYVGNYKNEKWLESNLKFDKRMKPNEIVDSYRMTKSSVNVRDKGSSKGKLKTGLKKGYEVHIKKIAVFGDYVWAKIKY